MRFKYSLAVLFFINFLILQNAFALENNDSSVDHAASNEATLSGQMGSEPNGIFPDPTASLSSTEMWNVDQGKAVPFPTSHLSPLSLTLHGYGFFDAIAEEGVDRGRADFSGPNMFQSDLGSPLGDSQYLNLDLVLTSDLWTVPSIGTPQLFQIGENQANSRSFIDAQPPLSSPILGLALSDTIALVQGDKSYLKLFFAPRGPSTDGPIPYLYRLTGMVNPDTPLGSIVGQDSGLVSSTVLGGELKLGGFHIEGSTFYGKEPDPTQVNLPFGTPDSYAIRFIQEFSSSFMLMASYAYVANPGIGISGTNRYSASFYSNMPISENWKLYSTFIYGGINNTNNSELLNSFLEEFALMNPKSAIYARIEAVQRTPNELAITGLPNPDSGRWITAITLGYSHQVTTWDGWELRAGAEVGNDQTPADYSTAYEGNPISYKFFFQLGGSQMYHL